MIFLRPFTNLANIGEREKGERGGDISASFFFHFFHFYFESSSK